MLRGPGCNPASLLAEAGEARLWRAKGPTGEKRLQHVGCVASLNEGQDAPWS
jgi:hypothetical protein